MLKRFTFLVLLLCIINNAYGNEVLKCLGQEELKLHKQKRTGPEYKLNQLFINEFASNSDIYLKISYQKKICNNLYSPPSVMVLKMLLTKGREIFDLRGEFGRDNLRGYKLKRIEDLLGRISHIFFRYLGSLQAKAATHDCLKKNIPEIAHFEQRFMHLEEEYTAKQLLSETEKFHKIFIKLRGINNIYKICQRDYEIKKAKREAELRKKK